MAADEHLALTLLWRGRTAEALARAESADRLRQRLSGFFFIGTDSAVLLTVLHIARGDAEAAGRAIDTLLQRLTRAAPGKMMFYLHGGGRALALLGRLPEAHSLLKRLQTMPNRMPLTHYLQHHLTGLLALLEGRPGDAAAALEQAIELEQTLPIAWVGGSARLLKARLLLMQGGSEAAAAALAAPVLSEWEQAGTPGCALLDGPAILPVLQLGARLGLPGAGPILALFPTPPPPPGQGAAAPPVPAGLVALPEPLTQREIDVLKLIVAGRSNPEIGEVLYITAETVKTHVARILRKLDVSSRTQAAVRGRELGL